MTPEEFKNRMLKCYDFSESGSYNDTETAHIDADDLMCKLLRELGYGDGIDVFEKQDKWYA